ncbi:CHAT domain-containing protein [Thelonectria olida]|uniref:CHAT domain-containing protein n=1 Tax=Thelonectria olida TaxID=1576542 RepID=A0A9P8VX93_9HYPO|nr:CHAT domain-containing protein [Thelonectria olida]
MALLGFGLGVMYGSRKNMKHLEEGIRVTTQAAETAPPDDPDRAWILKCLSDHLANQYMATGAAHHLEQAIKTCKEATKISPHDSRAECLTSLALHLGDRYHITREVDDLHEAIQIAKQAVGLASGSSLDMLGYMCNLGGLLENLHSRTGDMVPLEEAIQVSKQMVDQVTENSPLRESIFQNLGSQLGSRYLRTGAPGDIDEAVGFGRLALDSMVEENPYRLIALDSLAVNLGFRFSMTADMKDIEESIQLLREAGEMAEDEAERPRILSNLAMHLHMRFERTAALSDLHEAVRVARESVENTPSDHLKLGQHLHTLSIQLGELYTRMGTIDDLTEAIRIAEEAVEATPNDDQLFPSYLDNLSCQLGDLFQRLGHRDDLDKAIASSRKAVEMTPANHIDLPNTLSNLSRRLGDLYSESGSIADIEEAVQVATKCLELTPSNHADMPDFLYTLANSLGLRYEETRELSSLEEAIRVAKQGLDIAPDDPFLLNTLAIFLRNRFLRVGEVKDLNQAIPVVERAISVTPLEHADLGTRLQSLANILSDRYMVTGALADLERSIEVMRQSLAATPVGYREHAGALNNVGSILGDRFLRAGAMVDLTEAIELAQKAVDKSQDDPKQQAMYLNTLGIRLGDLYSRTGSEVDLETAIQACEKAVALTPSDDPYRGGRLNALGIQLGTRHSRTRVTADLKRAIRLAREAVDATPTDHPDCAMFLNTLGFQLNDLFGVTKAMSDLQDAISATQMAVEACPKEHPDRAIYLNNLASRLHDRFLITKLPSDLAMAISYYKTALKQVSSRTITRIEGAIALIQICASNSKWEQAFDAAEVAISLIPTMSPRSLEHSDKQHALTQVVGLASVSAAVALQAGNGPLTALNFLEQEKYPELAQQFVNLRDELHASRSTSALALKEGHELPDQNRSNRRYAVDSELDGLITAIRTKPGFESFLTVPDETSLRAAATFGPIVVINVTAYRCDALVLTKDQIRVVHLPKLKTTELEERAQLGDRGSLKALEWLWDVVANPILDALGITQPPPLDDWPHIWWIPTGILSSFPIHAAGYHMDGSSRTVLDRAMSSYSSSVKAIIQSRQRQVNSPSQARALVVSMKETPGHHALPFATKEAAVLRDWCDSMGVDTVTPERKKQDILSHLPSCSIFHFAGHGHTNSSDPSQSALLLEDWETEQLTVAALLEIDLRGRQPFLAYLSACGTGEIKDERFVDESLHLVSAFQLSGFRHVIGTLWGVIDEMCVDMSRITYREMMKGGMLDGSVCRGLHVASRELRTRWLSQTASTIRDSASANGMPEVVSNSRSISVVTLSQRDVIVVDSDECHSSSPDWVPYVHFGV